MSESAPAVLAYVVADDTRCRFLDLERGRVPRWIPNQAKATQFTSKRDADLMRDTIPDGYITVPVVGRG